MSDTMGDSHYTMVYDYEHRRYVLIDDYGRQPDFFKRDENRLLGFGYRDQKCEVCRAAYCYYDINPDVVNAIPVLEGEEPPQCQCLECLQLDLMREIQLDDFDRHDPAYVRRCDCCDKPFMVLNELQWYCSRECGERSKWTLRKTCRNKWCEKRFVPKRSDQVYCCRDCSSTARQRDPLETRVCACGCGQKFCPDSPRQKYVDLAHLGAARKEASRVKHEPRECACGCGKTFVPKRVDQRYYERDCALRHARATRSESAVERKIKRMSDNEKEYFKRQLGL